MKEKAFSFTQDYQVMNPNKEVEFVIKGKPFSWGNKLSFRDTSGRELALIDQKMSFLKPSYQIIINGNVFAEVIKEFSWFNKKFTLDVPGPNDYEIDGSFWNYDYRFHRGGKVVAEVSKKHFSWTDTYGIEIDDDEDYLSILCTVIVIDLVCHEDSD